MRPIVLALVLAACGQSGNAHEGTDDAARPGDAAADTGIDAPAVTPPDAAIDAPLDAALDAPPDAALDAPPDAAPDAPPGTFVITPPVFGLIITRNPARRLTHLANHTGAAISLAPSIAPGTDFLLEGSVNTTCGASLAPGDECDIEVTCLPTALGPRTGTLKLGDPDATTVALAATGGYLLFVTIGGAGSGHITSDPPGIDCGATCGALFTTAVTLTAVPDGDAIWTGWSGATLAVTPPSPENFVALSGHWALFGTLAITAGGDQPFEVSGFDGADFSCDGPCTRAVEIGAAVDIDGTTPAQFVGFSGACTGPHCSFTATGDDTVAFTATGDTHLTRAYHLATLIESGDVLPGGDFVVGAADGVSRIEAATGAVLWTVPDTGLTAVAAAANGHVVALADQTLTYLDASDGTVLWSRAADDTRFPAGTFAQLAVSPLDGNIAVSTGGGTQVTVFTQAGDVAFTVPLRADGVLYRSDGTLDVFVIRNPTVSHSPLDIHPVTPAGAALTVVINTATHYLSGGLDALALDSAGRVVSSTTSDATVELRLGGAFDILEDFSAEDLEVPLVSVAPDDHIWWARSRDGEHGFTLELDTQALVDELSLDSYGTEIEREFVLQRQLRALPDGGVVVFAEYDSGISSLRGAILIYER